VSADGAQLRSYVPRTSRRQQPGETFPSAGVRGNARLIALSGLVLLVLLFVEGMTVLSVRGMLTVHVFVGLLLLPPIGLKLAVTGYRFARYYLGSTAYRAAGPPQIILRVLAPFLIFCTAGLFGTGLALLVTGPGGGDTWRSLHQMSFFLWFGLMTVHVLAYTPRAVRLGLADLVERGRNSRLLAGALTREGLVIGSVILGVVVAVVFLPSDASWLQWASRLHFDR
jgi:hypothetical protein